jgi:hypothetical protein
MNSRYSAYCLFTTFCIALYAAPSTAALNNVVNTTNQTIDTLLKHSKTKIAVAPEKESITQQIANLTSQIEKLGQHCNTIRKQYFHQGNADAEDYWTDNDFKTKFDSLSKEKLQAEFHLYKIKQSLTILLDEWDMSEEEEDCKDAGCYATSINYARSNYGKR